MLRDKHNKPLAWNKPVACEQLGRVDLSPWREEQIPTIEVFRK
jgi:hypothetical protein